MTEKTELEKLKRYSWHCRCTANGYDAIEEDPLGDYVFIEDVEEMIAKHFDRKQLNCKICGKKDQYSKDTLCKNCFLKWVKLEKTYIEKKKVKNAIESCPMWIQNKLKKELELK